MLSVQKTIRIIIFQLQPSHFWPLCSDFYSIFLLLCGLAISVSTCRPYCHGGPFLYPWQKIKVTFSEKAQIQTSIQYIKIDKLDVPTFYWLPKLHKKNLINHAPYQILVTALLPSYHIILQPLSKQSNIMLSSTVKLSLAILMWIISGPSKTLPKSSKSCVCEIFRVLKYLLSIFLLYTHPCHLISSKQKCCILLNGVITESQKLTSVRQIKRDFLQQEKWIVCMCLTCTELCEAFTFLMENIYVQFDGMVYQQIVGIPMGTNCAKHIADLFLCCYERDFMSNLQKSKRFDLIDKFNDTSRYLDDIFTIDKPTFAEHIPDIYPRELQLNKTDTSDKETSFW